MPDAATRRPSNQLPRLAVPAAAALLAATMLSVATVRFGGPQPPAQLDAPAVATRALRFEDRPDGSVAVIDPASGAELDRVQGEAGFLRGTLRALARERQRHALGAGPAFELIAHADGRLTLADPATQARIDLESFGPTNAAVFARLLTLAPAAHSSGS
jgi:putative photosynthetic complex assembly protein